MLIPAQVHSMSVLKNRTPCLRLLLENDKVQGILVGVGGWRTHFVREHAG